MSTNSTDLATAAAPQLLTITPYPNPAGRDASVLLTGAHGAYSLLLYGMDGRLYRTQRLEHEGGGATTIALPLAGLPSGRYLLVAQNANGVPVARSAVVVW